MFERAVEFSLSLLKHSYKAQKWSVTQFVFGCLITAGRAGGPRDEASEDLILIYGRWRDKCARVSDDGQSVLIRETREETSLHILGRRTTLSAASLAESSSPKFPRFGVKFKPGQSIQ